MNGLQRLLEGLPKAVAILGVIMDQHNLNQSYFREEVGGKSLVSLTMKGERKLTLNHMRNLYHRFGIQVSSFNE